MSTPFTTLSQALRQLLASQDIDAALTWDGESAYIVKDKAEPTAEGHRTILSRSQLVAYTGVETYSPHSHHWVTANRVQWFADAAPKYKCSVCGYVTTSPRRIAHYAVKLRCEDVRCDGAAFKL